MTTKGDNQGMKHRFAQRLRNWADRLDHYGAPKCTGFGFTFEQGRGFVVHQDGHGCPIWYYGNDEYDKAFNARPAQHAG
jgi:hypothetical protein